MSIAMILLVPALALVGPPLLVGGSFAPALMHTLVLVAGHLLPLVD